MLKREKGKEKDLKIHLSAGGAYVFQRVAKAVLNPLRPSSPSGHEGGRQSSGLTEHQ